MSQPSPLRWRALALLALAQFMVIMDTSIIGVALPELGADLGFAQAELSWVFNAYVIAFGGLLLLGGKLSDVYGARRLFAIGFAVLTGASLVAGLADGPGLEIAARAAQGVGAALIAPASGIVNTTYRIGSALGLAAMTAVATSNGAGEIGDAARLVDGFSAAFVGAAGIALVGAVVGIAFLRQPTAEAPATGEAPQPLAA